MTVRPATDRTVAVYALGFGLVAFLLFGLMWLL